MIVLLRIISVILSYYSVTTFSVDEKYDDNNITYLYRHVANARGSARNISDSVLSIWNITSSLNLNKKNADNNALMPASLNRNGLSDKSNLWPNGIIPISVEGYYTLEERELIIQAIDTLEYWTCIRFVPYTGQEDYMVIINKANRGCKADVGFTGGRQEIKLEAPNCFDKIGTVLHEILHVVGLIDEHRRPNRDRYVFVHENNVIIGKEKIFRKIRQRTSDYGVPYDYNSVMHLPSYAYSANGQITIEPVMRGYSIGQRGGMSVRDAIKVANMYQCFYELDITQNYSKILPLSNETFYPRDLLAVLYFKGKMRRN